MYKQGCREDVIPSSKGCTNTAAEKTFVRQVFDPNVGRPPLDPFEARLLVRLGVAGGEPGRMACAFPERASIRTRLHD